MAEKVGGCCGKIKTAWEKGSTTETPVRHKNGLKTSLTIFFFLNAQNLGRSDDAKRRKKRGWPKQLKKILGIKDRLLYTNVVIQTPFGIFTLYFSFRERFLFQFYSLFWPGIAFDVKTPCCLSYLGRSKVLN